MKLPRRKFLHLAVGAAALPALSRIARAEAYPSRLVRLIVPFPAGGPTDVVARLMGQWLSDRLGQPFIIENRSGAGAQSKIPAAVARQPRSWLGWKNLSAVDTHRTVDHDASGLIRGREAVEVYHPEMPTEPLLHAARDRQSEQRLRTFSRISPARASSMASSRSGVLCNVSNKEPRQSSAISGSAGSGCDRLFMLVPWEQL